MGLTRVALAVRQSVDAVTFALYHDLLAERTEPHEWEALTRALAVHPPRGQDDRPRFPTIVEFLDALEEFRGAPPLDQEATDAYERVLTASTYTAEGGATWSYRDVRERCGQAAAEAFLAAGGHHAFATTWDESRRRARFLAAYQVEARERPAGRLLPAGPSRLLEAGGTEQAEIPRDEAPGLLREISQRSGTAGMHGGTRRAVTRVVATPERLEELREQAKQLGEEGRA